MGTKLYEKMLLSMFLIVEELQLSNTCIPEQIEEDLFNWIVWAPKLLQEVKNKDINYQKLFRQDDNKMVNNHQ